VTAWIGRHGGMGSGWLRRRHRLRIWGLTGKIDGQIGFGERHGRVRLGRLSGRIVERYSASVGKRISAEVFRESEKLKVRESNE